MDVDLMDGRIYSMKGPGGLECPGLTFSLKQGFADVLWFFGLGFSV